MDVDEREQLAGGAGRRTTVLRTSILAVRAGAGSSQDASNWTLQARRRSQSRPATGSTRRYSALGTRTRQTRVTSPADRPLNHRPVAKTDAQEAPGGAQEEPDRALQQPPVVNQIGPEAMRPDSTAASGDRPTHALIFLAPSTAAGVTHP